MNDARGLTRDMNRIPVLRPILVAALAYVLFTLVALGLHGMDPLWFVWLDDEFFVSAPAGSIGYDGQFVYAIARDGISTAQLDTPPYRLQRILLPALVRALSFGSEALIPWVLLLANGLAVIVGTAILARWLDAHDIRPTYALIYPFFVGTLMAYSRSLTEPLAGTLSLAAVSSWDRDRVPLAAALLGLACLAKETALVYGTAFAMQALVMRRPLSVAWLAVGLLSPVIWQLYLAARYGVVPLLAGASLDHTWPLGGMLPQLSWDPGRLSALIVVAIPAAVLCPLALRRLLRESTDVGWWLVLLHALAMLFLPEEVYDHVMHAGRNAIGLACSVLWCFPGLNPRERGLAAMWWCLPSLIWLVPILRWTPWP